MGTARALDAAVHAAMAVLVYACCRAAGVRIALATATAAAVPIVCWPAWPYVSPHWMSSALTLALVWTALRKPISRSASAAAAAGALLGAMALVQHQRAAVFAAAVTLLMIADWALAGGARPPRSLRTLAARLAVCAGTTLAVVAPFAVLWLATAGPGHVFEALVMHPLFRYRPALRATWGEVWPLMTGRYAAMTIPVLLRWAPAALPVVAAAGLVAWRSGRVDRARAAGVVTVVGAAAVGSSWYFPDLIHLSFIAPVCIVALALLAEWAARALPDVVRPRVLVRLAAACIVALLVWRAAVVRAAVWRRIQVTAATSFGRVDFDDRDQLSLIRAIDALVANDPRRRLFCYPGYPALYLLTDTWNPTPLQIALPGYSTTEQLALVRDRLAADPPSAIVLVSEMVPADDPLRRMIGEHYEPVPEQRHLWHRRQNGAAGESSTAPAAAPALARQPRPAERR